MAAYNEYFNDYNMPRYRSITMEDYCALESKDPNCLYYIEGGVFIYKGGVPYGAGGFDSLSDAAGVKTALSFTDNTAVETITENETGRLIAKRETELSNPAVITETTTFYAADGVTAIKTVTANYGISDTVTKEVT